MSAEACREAFRDEMRVLRALPTRPDPSEVARIARKAGLSPHEALLEIQRYTEFGRIRTNEVFDAVALFISSICRDQKSKRVLEYTVMPSVLTAGLAETGEVGIVEYVAPNQNIAETLTILFEGKSVSVRQSIQDLDSSLEFDVIVCQPPIGHRPSGDNAADGFGGEVVRQLAPFLAKEGTLYWVTGRGALFNSRPKKTLVDLQREGLNTAVTIDVASGAFPGAMIEGVVIALRRKVPAKRFVGALRDLETAGPMASAFLAGPSRKDGVGWTWLDTEDQRSFADFEQARLLQKLTPRGRHTALPLGSLLASESVEKADRPAPDGDQVAAFLFIPEYVGSRVTADLEEQTVKPKAIYRLAVDPAKANPRFLAQLLNSPYGKKLRAAVASGVTIQRLSTASLLTLELPIPDMETQDRIVRIDSDIGLLQAAFRDMQGALDQDWAALSDVAEKIDALKAVLDIERQIADWWRELPYPLATIYRRYQVSAEPKERLDTLLHFFEMAAVFLAAIGTSHVKAMRQDWEEVIAKWLHPAEAAGIERTDFGFWISLAGASLKDTRRIASDKNLREIAIEIAGPELVQVAESIGPLGKATEVLDIARHHRNRWKGHGGHIKESDATRLVGELQQSIRDFYEITASVFRRFQLVRPGMAEVTDTGFKYEIEKLSGSDPTFETEKVELDRPAKTNALAFWMSGSRTMCRALPFFRLGIPQQPQETSFYVFNRVENGGFRWISYQEAREQEFVAPDDELLGIIALGSDVT